MKLPYKYTVLDRFCKYVKIDTQSDPESPTQPSTEKQKNLSKILVNELLEMGISDAHLDEFGYVYATLPSNTNKKVPVICFCSHVDTSPDCSGENVNPIIHENYQGNDILFINNSEIKLSPKEHPELLNQIGNNIITADGTTLLGADNKAGVAEIMDAINYLVLNPQIKHGDIKILFTPDEEIGRGVDKVDIKKLAADFAYTIDGETLGHVEDETFSANGCIINVYGVSTHPGFAKDKMESAIKIASEIIAKLPKEHAPESTHIKQAFIHPTSIEGQIEQAKINLILRAFDDNTLLAMERILRDIVTEVNKNYINSKIEINVYEQYRNMKTILDQYPQVSEIAIKAIERAGLKAIKESIRGGTDGSRLSFMGLPCPNIFAGEHAFHSKLEWVSEQDMQKAVETIVNIAQIWEEES